MAQTRVDSFFFDGNLSAAEVSRRVGQEASPASSLPMENSMAATKRLAWANGGMSTVFVPYKSPVDRLRGLPMTLWRNRDIQYVKDIAEIRKAISLAAGEDEDKLFLSPSVDNLRRFEQPSDCEFFSFDCSLRGGTWSEAIVSLSEALDIQISEFMATRFNSGVKKLCTMVLRMVGS